MTGMDWRRAHLLSLQKYCCYLCGKVMARRKKRNSMAQWRTVDHIMPRALGGPQRGDNIAMAHQCCNSVKGDRLPHPCEILVGQVLHQRLTALRARDQGK